MPLITLSSLLLLITDSLAAVTSRHLLWLAQSQ